MSENIPENRACSFAGCGYAHYALGLCQAHYRMQGRGQDLRPVKRRFAHTGCIVEGCPRPHRSMGLCTPHYVQQQRGQDLRPIEVPERHTVCAFPDCGKQPLSKGVVPRPLQPVPAGPLDGPAAPGRPQSGLRRGPLRR